MAKETFSGILEGELPRLRSQVERGAGFEARTPKQFDRLAELIYSRTGVLLSPTTLKRLWNYLDEPVTPRRSTLDVLARFSGWGDFAAFEKGDEPELESGNVGNSVIRCDENIRRGDRVRLFWNPGRVCDIEYLGEMKWKVVSVRKTRLKPGDIFRCPLIVAGEPLYLDKLVKDVNCGGVYVCGSKSGISFERLE